MNGPDEANVKMSASVRDNIENIHGFLSRNALDAVVGSGELNISKAVVTKHVT